MTHAAHIPLRRRMDQALTMVTNERDEANRQFNESVANNGSVCHLRQLCFEALPYPLSPYSSASNDWVFLAFLSLAGHVDYPKLAEELKDMVATIDLLKEKVKILADEKAMLEDELAKVSV
jgi:hypothetical protein